MLPWTQVHAAVVHFPIALLTLAPLLVLLGLCVPGQRRGLHTAALLLLVLGSLGALVAVASGLGASPMAQGTPALRLAVARHESLAETAATLFGALTVTFAVLHLLPWGNLGSGTGRAVTALCLLWLLLAAGAMATLTLAAHVGGTMVHVLNIHGHPPPFLAPRPAVPPLTRPDAGPSI